MVVGKDGHRSGCGTRAWSPTLVTAPLNTSEALPGNLMPAVIALKVAAEMKKYFVV